MKENKFNTNVIRLWLFKVSLLLSVFAFSGFNVQVQAAFLESDKTELVDSRINKPVYDLESSGKKSSKVPNATLYLRAFLFNNWSLLNQNRLVELKFKTSNKEIFLYNISSIIFPFKILFSSSDDELPA